MSMNLFSRRTAMVAGLAALLVACGNTQDTDPAADPVPSNSTNEAVVMFDTDMIMGSRDAPVVLVEYASLTCPGCRAFHEQIAIPILKPLTETGDFAYIFREFPTPPIALSKAGSMIARCTGDDNFFDTVDDFFSTQQGLVEAARRGQQRVALEALANRNGLDAAAMNECLRNAEVREAVDRSERTGRAAGVDSTPTLFLNGERISPQTPDSMRTLIEEAIAEAKGGDAEAEAASEAETDSEAGGEE